MLPFEHSTQLRVRYAETDQMGVVWHGHYVQYFEAARTDALRANGGSYRALEASGIMMPVVELGISYHKPARYDDLLTIVTRVAEPPGARLRFDYEILNEAREQLVTGYTTLAFMDAATRRPCRPPHSLRALFT
ncbi:MAG: thioesterase family protein [Kiritimatiellae bacterium]|nr:thioesterase family protein [Kiritimatiellia bacterium]